MHSDPTGNINIISLGQAMGFYNWDVLENRLYGDSYLAELYGLPREDLAKGMQVEKIFSIILEEDRPSIAANIHRAILTGEASNGQFRVLHPNGAARSLIAFGRCLRDETGIPTFYTGAVLDASSSVKSHTTDPLQAYCRAALAVAEGRGNELAARYLSSAIRQLYS